MKFTLENLTITANRLPADVDSQLHKYLAAAAGVPADSIRGYAIRKRSIDARQKPTIKLLYTVTVDVRDDIVPLKPVKPSATEELWHFPDNRSKVQNPIVIGAGPAGLFCAYVLALAGAAPIVLERGYDVQRRGADIQAFYRNRVLNPESNLLFGEGGAGTWSDGKLFTRLKDPRISFVLQTFMEHGAPPQTGYFAHPHLGSDRLPDIISRLRQSIIAAGGQFRWGTCVKRLLLKQGRCAGVVLTNGETLEAQSVIAANGHSAREFILELIQQGVACTPKGFQIGSRIEHPQSLINRLQFGMETPPPAVGAAEYNYVSKPPQGSQQSGVTTFCQCPGGEIIPATSACNQLATNGMSNASRSGKFANSALITTIPADAFNTPAEAFAFLDNLEKRAFTLGGSDYTCPAQSARDFLSGSQPKRLPEASCPTGIHGARIDKLLPWKVTDALRRAVVHFERNAPGFLSQGLFIGPETRVSSPVRLDRDAQTLSTSIPGFYACGEGAGLAGGITSAAVDGMKIAEALLSAASH